MSCSLELEETSIDGFSIFSRNSSKQVVDHSRGVQFDDLQVDHHDRSIPKELYGYSLHGRRLHLRSGTTAKLVVQHVNQQLKLLSARFKQLQPYTSMSPFSLSPAGKTADSSVHLELALHFRVLEEKDGRMHAALLYCFYTPFHYIEPPRSVKNGRALSNSTDGNKPVVLTGFHLDYNKDIFHSDHIHDFQFLDGGDQPDGGNGTNCQHPGHAFNFKCFGVGSHTQADGPFMTVHQYGRVTCDGWSEYFRPSQFMILYDTDNNTDLGLIVAILSYGFGPKESFFLALEEDKATGTSFVVKIAPKNDLRVPSDPQFHFRMTRDKELEVAYRFQAVTGDKRYLAFGSDGKQVKVTADDIEHSKDKALLKQSLMQFSPIVD